MSGRGDQQGRAAASHPHPLRQQPAWPGLQPGRESLSLSQKFSSKGFPAPTLQHQCVVDSSGLLLVLFIFIFINIAKNRYFPWEVAVCIPLLVDIYRTPLCAASECLVVLTGFILTFTPSRQGIVCRHTGLKLRQPSPELKSGRSPLRCHLTLAMLQPKAFLQLSTLEAPTFQLLQLAVGSIEQHSLHLQYPEIRWSNALIPRGTLSRCFLKTCNTHTKQAAPLSGTRFACFLPLTHRAGTHPHCQAISCLGLTPRLS